MKFEHLKILYDVYLEFKLWASFSHSDVCHCNVFDAAQIEELLARLRHYEGSHDGHAHQQHAHHGPAHQHYEGGGKYHAHSGHDIHGQHEHAHQNFNAHHHHGGYHDADLQHHHYDQGDF